MNEFRKCYGPTMNAFEAAEKDGRATDLQKELESLFDSQNQSKDATSHPGKVPACDSRPLKDDTTSAASGLSTICPLFRSKTNANPRNFFERSRAQRNGNSMIARPRAASQSTKADSLVGFLCPAVTRRAGKDVARPSTSRTTFLWILYAPGRHPLHQDFCRSHRRSSGAADRSQ